MLKFLRNLLASCHWSNNVQTFPFIKERNRDYCEQRALEAIREAMLLQHESDPALYERSLRLAIRLLVMAMFRFRQERDKDYGTSQAKKNKKKRARSKNPRGRNDSPHT